MSRKSRHRERPELASEQIAADPPGETRTSVHHLTGTLRDTFEAIVSGCAITARAAELPEVLDAVSAVLSPVDDDLVDDVFGDAESSELDELLQLELDDDALDDDIDDDELSDDEIDAGVAELGEAFGELGLTTRILARELLARALGRRPTQTGVSFIPAAPDAEGGTDATIIDAIVYSLLPANLPAPMRSSGADRREAIDDAAHLIREVGLEEFDVSCDLATPLGGTPELFTYPLSPESAHVALLEFLFERAEGAVESLDPLLVPERDASSWEFARWSASPPPGHGSPDVADFSRAVREQEHSLAERRSTALGMSVTGEIAKDQEFAELFPRQHRMAAALTASFVDVFECVALEGSRVTLRSMHDGRTYDVHEHMEPIVYAAGWVAAGRLVPFDGETYLRTPGMIFFQPEDPAFVRTAVEEFGSARGSLAPALALEAFISSAVFDVPVPRAVKPARSKAAARELLAMIEDILADVALEREPTPDATLEAFMTALADQASAGRRRQNEQWRTRPKTHKGKRRR